MRCGSVSWDVRQKRWVGYLAATPSLAGTCLGAVCPRAGPESASEVHDGELQKREVGFVYLFLLGLPLIIGQASVLDVCECGSFCKYTGSGRDPAQTRQAARHLKCTEYRHDDGLVI